MKKRYCIHCGKESTSNNIKCKNCNKNINDIDSDAKELLYGEVQDKLLDKGTDLITSFIKQHLYGIVLSLTIISVVTANVIVSNNMHSSETKAEVKQLASCRPKKFDKKYEYVYESFDECKSQGNIVHYELINSGKYPTLTVYGCIPIKDECENDYYANDFYVWVGTDDPRANNQGYMIVYG